MDLSPLHERLHAVAGHLSYRRLAELTGQNSETVRRYMQGQSPSVEFVSALCDRLGVSGEWLLTSRGPKLQKDTKDHALRQSSPGELLAAMAAALESLAERVDRLEAFTQTLDVRLRVRNREHDHDHTRARPEAPKPSGAAARAHGIAGVISQRSREVDRAGAAPREP